MTLLFSKVFNVDWAQYNTVHKHEYKLQFYSTKNTMQSCYDNYDDKNNNKHFIAITQLNLCYLRHAYPVKKLMVLLEKFYCTHPCGQ